MDQLLAPRPMLRAGFVISDGGRFYGVGSALLSAECPVAIDASRVRAAQLEAPRAGAGAGATEPTGTAGRASAR